MVGQAQSGSDQQLRLIVDHGAAASGVSNGTIRFGLAKTLPIAWQNNDEAAIGDLPTAPLADGLAAVFRSHRPVMLTGVPGSKNPLYFTVGQGPYEPTMSDFLAACPPTRALMPTLVRIRRAKRLPVPDSLPARVADPVMTAVPNYPPDALKKHEVGVVRLVASRTPDGHVLWPEVVQSSGYPALDRSAKNAFEHSRYGRQPLAADELYIFHQVFAFDVPPDNTDSIRP